MRVTWVFGLLCLIVPSLAAAEPPASLDDRAAILSIEMRRDAAALTPYLRKPAGSELRRLAIRALGRIGNDGTGPGILRDILNAPQSGDPDLRLWLWAAGIARSKELAEPLMRQLDASLESGQLIYACQAGRSLGWTGGEGVPEKLLPLLRHASPAIRTAALVGLARARPKTREVLDAVSKLANDPSPDVRAAADLASWLTAGGYRGARAEDDSWDGDAEIAQRFLGHLNAADPDRRMGGIRVLGSLMPEAPKVDGPYRAVMGLVSDPDPRVGQDAVSRIFAKREGGLADDALIVALGHADPKMRHLAAEALGQHATPAAIAALQMRFGEEPDARVREVLAVELARVGKEEAWQALRKREDRPQDEAIVQQTEVQILLASKRPEAIGELLKWADPGASQRVDMHAVTWMATLSGLEGKEHPKLEEWLLGFLNGGYAIDRDERHFVIAAAVSLVESSKIHSLGPTLLGLVEKSPFGKPHAEIRSALMKAFGTLAGDEKCPAETAAAMRAAVEKQMTKDESPWVRAVARRAATALKLADVPEHDEGQPNEWRGVPRAVEPLAGVDPQGDGEYLNEKEILRLADWMRRARPLIVFDTTAGSFSVELDPQGAPTHSVSLLNAVRNGVYEDTRWHRVVPNFVIQGGDPHGHGAGGGGWTVPDEITRSPYVRGALGMPKSMKDDGGCQIFVMHTAYHPLDERYTCYGHVRNGMGTVDKIRVGDFIKHARVVIPSR